MQHLYDLQGEIEDTILRKMAIVEEAKTALRLSLNMALAEAIVVVQKDIEGLRKRLNGVASIIAKYHLG